MKIVKNLLLLTLFTLVFNPTIAKENVLNIGLLKYGSVNWEMDIIKHNNLDKKNNFVIKEKLYELVLNMCSHITTPYKYNLTENIKNEETHIRIPCLDRIKGECHLTKYCEMADSCKLYIPRIKYRLFIGMIVSEMLKYGKREYSSGKLSINVSGRILDNTVNHIADLDNFIDSIDGQFERRTPSENLLSKIRLNKDL